VRESKLSLLKNTVALSVPNVLNPLASFVLILIISRYLGISGLGQYALVLAYVGIFRTLASLGLEALLVREVSRTPRDAHVFFTNAGIFGVVSSLVAMIAMNVIVGAMGYGEEVIKASMIGSCTLVFWTTTAYMDSIFRSREQSEYIAFVYVAENLIRVGGCIVLVLYGYGIAVLFVAILVSRILGFAMMSYAYVSVIGRPTWEFRSEIWKNLARQAPVFTSIVIFSTIHLSIDQIMLSKLAGIDSVGIYSAADRLLQISRTLPLAFSAALLPMFSRDFAAGLGDLKGLTISSLRYVFLGCMPIVVGTAVLADDIVTLLYGDKFIHAGAVLRLHIFSLVPFGMVYILAQFLIATNNQKIDLTINAVSAGINVCLNFLLIPYFAEIGAVLATLITIIVFNQLQYWYIRRHLFSIPFLEIVPKILAASAVMGGLTYFLKDWNIFLNVAVSGLAYIALILLLKALSPDETAFLKGLLKGGRN
jgi:O-antigen/teichoic acid export membrane protein